MAQLKALMEEEIPEGRQALLESHQNLQRVSAYCTQKYLDEDDKQRVLLETKGFTTQSLASVAYQINTLASNMLNMLDIQAVQLANMESSLNVISQSVDIHKEKVARREIGLLTATKNVTRTLRITYPSTPDRAVKYIRKPIDYTECDDIGHGVKLNVRSGSGTMKRHASVNKHPASPNPDRMSSDLSKSGSISGYGTLRAVKAPTVPMDFNSSKRASRLRTNSNSSSGSGSIASSTGPQHFSIPSAPSIASSGVSRSPSVISSIPPTEPVIPPPPSISMSMIPPPPPLGATTATPISMIPPAPPLNNFGIPPPPALNNMASPMMCPPPPPPNVGASASPTLRNSGGYSLPVTGQNNMPPPVKESADSYAATSVMDLPPPPPADMPAPPPLNVMPAPPPLNIMPAPPMLNNSSMLPPPPPLMAAATDAEAPENYIEKMVVLYEYAAQNSDELNLKEEDVVYVVKMNHDGWYEGVIRGETGLFPGNYVEPY